MRSSSAPDPEGLADCRWLRGLVRRAVRQPISLPVPADDVAYLRRKGCLRLAFRVAKRRVLLACSGQQRLLRDAIDPAWTRLLWIQIEAPQLGDTLMDLAPRSLLAERGRMVDVVTTPLLASLLRGDRWLRRELSTDETVDAAGYHARYDAVITSSHAPRALAWKRRHVPRLPWVAIAGDYTVPDYQRAQFATARLADLLGVTLTPAERAVHARQKLGVPLLASMPSPWPDDRRSVAIAVGGVWADRSYAHWPAVVAALRAAGVARVRLLGSGNGRAAADAIVRTAPAGLHIDDGVDCLDLHATRAAISASGVAVCADGGLLHLALTTSTPVVALFNRDVAPAWRLPVDVDGVALQSTTKAVSEVAAQRVVDAALGVLDGR